MRVIPVLDLKGGRAVHAVAGDRGRYGPLRSVFHPKPDPVTLARGMVDRLGATEVYVADLDAIVDRVEPAYATFRAIGGLGLAIWADVGIEDGPVPTRLADSGVTWIIAGSETLRGPEALARVVEGAPLGSVVLSLDLREGVPILAANHTWTGDVRSEANLVAQAVEVGVRTIIRLDLAGVGTGRGVADIPAVPRFKPTHPALHWITGGGITSPADLETLARLGYSAALVGSALHDGRIATF